MKFSPVFDELADLLASMDPDKVLAFHTSQQSQERLAVLLAKNKTTSGLSEAEEAEVKQYMLLEHILLSY